MNEQNVLDWLKARRNRTLWLKCGAGMRKRYD